MSSGDYLARYMSCESQNSNKDPLSAYITKDKDYTGCHPVIAEALRRGLRIRCTCWNEDNPSYVIEMFIMDLVRGIRGDTVYLDEFDTEWDCAVPIKRGEG